LFLSDQTFYFYKRDGKIFKEVNKVYEGYVLSFHFEGPETLLFLNDKSKNSKLIFQRVKRRNENYSSLFQRKNSIINSEKSRIQANIQRPRNKKDLS